MEIYLIRHGQSTYNAEDRIQGQANPPLSELGRQQGAAAAAAFQNVPVATIWASPLARAAETAQFVAKVAECPIQYDDRLKEVDCGEFRDRIRTEVMESHPEAIPRWRSCDSTFRFPGGESRLELIKRGKAVFEEIIENAARQGQEIVVIASHGGLLLAAMKAVLGLKSEDPPYSLKNASITQLTVDSTGRAELADFDRIDHLDGIVTGVDW